MSSLIHSLHKSKQKIARDVLQKASSLLLQGNNGENSNIPSPSRNRRNATSNGNAWAKGAAQMLQRSVDFFRELVLLAELQPRDRRIRMPAGLVGDFSAFLVPTQAALTISYPPPSVMSSASSEGDYFPTDQRFIASFNSMVEVMATKAKPKKIGLTTTCGQKPKFLLKQEKDGDLRKDEREWPNVGQSHDGGCYGKMIYAMYVCVHCRLDAVQWCRQPPAARGHGGPKAPAEVAHLLSHLSE